MFAIIYGGRETETLNKLQYRSYMNMSLSTIQPSKLPPTESAAKYHSFSVYLKIFKWEILWKKQLKVLTWG